MENIRDLLYNAVLGSKVNYEAGRKLLDMIETSDKGIYTIAILYDNIEIVRLSSDRPGEHLYREMLRKITDQGLRQYRPS